MAKLTIQSSAALLHGEYTLNFTNAIYVDENFNSQSFDSLGSYSITVVPEPTALALFGIAPALIIFRRKQRP